MSLKIFCIVSLIAENDNKESFMNNQQEKTKDLVQLSLFSGIIIVMAFTPFLGYIPLGFTRATIIHIPVIIASILYGPKKGAILGLVFGLTSLLNNTINPTISSFVFTPFYSVGEIQGGFASLVICLIPRILVGVTPFYTFNIIEKILKNHNRKRFYSLLFSGIIGSLTNTLLVMHLIFFFYKDAYALANGLSPDAVYIFIIGIIAMNGVPESIIASIVTLGLGKVLMRRK